MTDTAVTTKALAGLIEAAALASWVLLALEQRGRTGDDRLAGKAAEARTRLDTSLALIGGIADSPPDLRY